MTTTVPSKHRLVAPDASTSGQAAQAAVALRQFLEGHPKPESTDGLVGSTVWVWVAAGLVCLGGPVGVGAR